MTFDPMDDEHQAWRAECERLAALIPSAIDLRVQVDAFELDPAVLEEQHAHEPAA